MFFLLKFYVLVLMTALIVGAYKKAVTHENDHSSEVLWDINSHVDMKGKLSNTFFVFSALSTPEENTVCSPLSAMMPLGKLALGADGLALEELLAAIGVSKKNKVRHRFKPLIVVLRYLPGVKLDIGSTLYVSKKCHLQRAFVDQSRDVFDSSVQKIDFENPTYAAEQINAWVSSQTNYVIKDIISPSDITPTTSLILVNAVYFSGRWKERFDKLHNVTFHAPKGNKTIVMMSKTGYYNYTKSEALSSQIIQIPYMGEKATFVIILPTVRNGLSVLLSQLKLAPELLDLAMSKMVDTMIELTLPRFRIESKISLNYMYEKAGVKQIFRRNDSGLTKITKNDNLYVTTAKQKAFIEVNEFGTEAGASSSLFVATLSLHKPEIVLADHPFLFFILVKKQQLISGTFVNPD